jgi:hypothetical protein
MTYEELLKILQSLPKDRLKDTVTIYDDNSSEFFGVTGSDFSKEEECDQLDDGHFYLKVLL